MPSLNQITASFRALIDEQYAEGVHDGLVIARDTIVAARERGEDPVEYLSNALAYFEEHRT